MPAVARALDAEFLFLLSLLRPVFAALAGEHRDQAALWLRRLCHVPALVDGARRDRNEYLSRLYYGAMVGKLDNVFLDAPPEGALRPAQDVFPVVDLTSWLEDAAAGRGDHDVEATGTASAGGGDADERTYMATQVLPGGRGAFGYLAVSLARSGPHWAPGSANASRWPRGGPQATSTPILAPTDRQSPSQVPPSTSSSSSSGSLPTPAHGVAVQSGRGDDLLLPTRAPAEQRRLLPELYDRLIADLDQAMAEPEKTSPELEKIIASFQADESSASAGTDADDESSPSPHQRQLLTRLRTRLEERRQRILERSSLLDSLLEDRSDRAAQLLEAEAAASPGPRRRPLPSPSGRPAPRRTRPEDDVWSVRPENVALLEAAYPRRLTDRFLEALVRERVAALGKAHAHRFYQQHVEGAEEQAADDLVAYYDLTGDWASKLRQQRYADGSEVADAAEDAARRAEQCAEEADKAAKLAIELGEARARYFAREAEMEEEQNHLRAEVAMLQAQAAQRRRHPSSGPTAPEASK